MKKIKPTLSVYFYRESNGKEPVKNWLQSLDKVIKIIIGEDISKAQYRWPLNYPINQVLSIFGFFLPPEKKTMILLHGFIKKTEKLPSQDLKIAEERAKKYEQQEKKK